MKNCASAKFVMENTTYMTQSKTLIGTQTHRVDTLVCAPCVQIWQIRKHSSRMCADRALTRMNCELYHEVNCGQNERRLWKHYLPLRSVNIQNECPKWPIRNSLAVNHSPIYKHLWWPRHLWCNRWNNEWFDTLITKFFTDSVLSTQNMAQNSKLFCSLFSNMVKGAKKHRITRKPSACQPYVLRWPPDV